jgi:hypothetical protein
MNAIVSTSAVATATPVAMAKCIVTEQPDPILAVLDQHRSAYIAWLRILKEEDMLEEELPKDKRRSKCICGEMELHETDDPRWIANLRNYEETWSRVEAAAVAMTNVVPTTMAGILSMLAYIDEFNRGHVRLSCDRNCGSEHYQWPEELVDDDVLTAHFRKPLTMPWPYWVMRNVQAALRAVS